MWKRDYTKKKRCTKSVQMLHLGRIRPFKYDLREVLKSSGTEEKYIESFIATVVAKASKNSIVDAKEYVTKKCEEDHIDEGIEKDVLRLLRKYSKYR